MKIAVFGTGLLGRPIAERLAAAGFEVIAYNRTQAKAEPLREAGIAVAQHPWEAASAAECLILMLADYGAIRNVILDDAVRKVLRGRTVIQMATIGPDDSRALAAEVREAGGDYFECPVLGSVAEAQAGKLLLMVGSEEGQLDRWQQVLTALGPEPRLIGQVGQAAALKLALNHLIAAETAAFALSLGIVMRESIRVDDFLAILRNSALYAPTFDKKLPRLLDRNYTNPNFSTRHLLKDVNLCLAEADRLGLRTESLRGLPILLARTIELGLAEADYSALYEAVNPRRIGATDTAG